MTRYCRGSWTNSSVKFDPGQGCTPTTVLTSSNLVHLQIHPSSSCVIRQIKNRHRRSIVYTMLLAFVFNLLLSFFVPYSLSSAQASAEDSLASLIGDKVLLCTLNGYKWVSLSELQAGESEPGTEPHFKCPLCFLQLDKPETIPSDYSVLASVSPSYQFSRYSGTATESQKTIWLLFGRSSRGPPAKNLL